MGGGAQGAADALRCAGNATCFAEEPELGSGDHGFGDKSGELSDRRRIAGDCALEGIEATTDDLRADLALVLPEEGRGFDGAEQLLGGFGGEQRIGDDPGDDDIGDGIDEADETPCEAGDSPEGAEGLGQGEGRQTAIFLVDPPRHLDGLADASAFEESLHLFEDGDAAIGINVGGGILEGIEIAMQTGRIGGVAALRIGAEEDAEVGIVEAGLGIDEAAFVVVLVAGEAEGIGSVLDAGTFIAPGVPEVAGADGASWGGQLTDRSEAVEEIVGTAGETVVDGEQLIRTVIKAGGAAGIVAAQKDALLVVGGTLDPSSGLLADAQILEVIAIGGDRGAVLAELDEPVADIKAEARRLAGGGQSGGLVAIGIVAVSFKVSHAPKRKFSLFLPNRRGIGLSRLFPRIGQERR